MSPLKWHAMGYRCWSAWSTEAGEFTLFEFKIRMIEHPFASTLEIHDVRKKNNWAPYGLPILRVAFDHAEWTETQVKAFAETVRLTLPTFEGEQYILPTEEICAMAAAARTTQTVCRFVHAFPPGATNSTICQCGRLTKGFLEKAS